MIRIIICILLSNYNFCFGQITFNELSISGQYGPITSNNLVGTSKNYDHYPDFSGVNLKCKSVYGMRIQYNHFICKSKWHFNVNYDRYWLSYSTKLFSMNYNPNTVFNHIKELSFNNQVESFSTGGGRRFSIPNSRFSIDLIAALTYHFYQDLKIGSLLPIDYVKTSELEIGDFNYFVELDYSYYAKQLKFSTQSSIIFQCNPSLGINFQVTITSPIIGEYHYENLTRGNDEVIIPGQLTVAHLESSPYHDLGRIATRYISCGLGLNFKL